MSVTFARLTGAARRLSSDRASLRPVLMIGVPLIVLALIGYYYLISGRYVSTDNAYVKADMVSVSPDVGGRIVQGYVKQNETVKAVRPTFRFDRSEQRRVGKKV